MLRECGAIGEFQGTEVTTDYEKKGEGDGRLLLQSHLPLGGQQLSGCIPERAIDAHVLADGGNTTRAGQASGCCLAAQAAAQEVFLHMVVDPPEGRSVVLLSPTEEQL